MIQDWAHLTFLHWRIEREVIEPLLPSGLTVDLCDGWAWVGLVPFSMHTRFGPIPPLRYASIFPETNVRTYVRGPDGRAGVWFLSLDVPRLAAVLVARASYALPYMWSTMSIERNQQRLTYHCHRHWPAGRGTSSAITIEIDEAIPTAEVTELVHFLTDRWRLYTTRNDHLVTVPVEHEPWPLRRARAVHLDDGLVLAAGLAAPDGLPLVHYSPGVRARIGFPRPLR